MGKTKKKFNWKAREAVETIIDKNEERKIKLELQSSSKYDDCNALVLPSKKRKTKVKRPQSNPPKNRRVNFIAVKCEVVKKLYPSIQRAAMIDALSEVQVSTEQLNKMTSIAEIQNKGIKRRFNDDDKSWLKKVDVTTLKSLSLCREDQEFAINSVKGSRKRRRLLATMFPADKEKRKIEDPNIVGMDDSSSNQSSGDEEDDSEVIIKQESESEENTEDDSVLDKDEISESVESNQKALEGDKNLSTYKFQKTENKPNCSTIEVKKEPAVFVSVDRKPEIQAARLKLPILAEEQMIMEAINENPVVILAGETGSGKTTQIPQFLYEAGYTRNGQIIGITEPRRVAAISMSKRVAEELNLSSDKVSYLIRFEGNVTADTQIKFMTDGVLLKEIQKDFLLTKYSVIILDEAHERSVYTDILMGLLSRIVPLRNKRNIPLKLIIMSATLRVEDFTENKHLFKVTPPVIKVESRQFPVTIHFNKRTNPDYLKEAFRKICKIHTQLPEGGILVFLTGQQEVNGLVNKLKKAFPMRNQAILKKKVEEKENVEDDVDEVELNLDKALQKAKLNRKQEISLPQINLDRFVFVLNTTFYETAPRDDTDLDLLDESSDVEEDWGEDEIALHNVQPLWILPLYSVLPSKQQAKVFNPPPEGTRFCVVATNVAETSLTIPGIKYVVDTGKVKNKLYDKLTGVSAFSVQWASKAAANQRAGRAGRTSAGHCYRLYSSAVFDDFEEWSTPEMQRRCVDELVLQMKYLGIHRVVNFPFPSPPDSTQLKVAERMLVMLEALQKSEAGEKSEYSGKLTELGKLMARFPVAPRFSKMLCLSYQALDIFEYIICVVSALSVQEVLLTADDAATQQRRAKWAGKGAIQLLGDAMVLLRAIGAGEHAYVNGKLEEYCLLNKIRPKAIIEARKIRIQLIKEINLLNPMLNLPISLKLVPPNATQTRLMRQIILAGMVDNVARKCEENVQAKGKMKPLYNTPLLEQKVQIHSSSALYKEYPEWIVYQEIFQVSEKMYMRGIVAIEPEWLPVFAPTLCQLGSPLEDPPPRYNATKGTVHCHVKATFGRSGWELPVVEIEFPLGLDKYKWFAVFLLDGSVCPKLTKYTKSLLSTPQTMIRSWAKLQPRTELLLKTLVSNEVDSKEKLLNVWLSERTYLLASYQKWLPETAHNEVAMMWPPT
uniref:RNA helicase n=1 Tax=Rhodnius prolixus TaxID=13249 RepID=T1I963_RHOPR